MAAENDNKLGFQFAIGDDVYDYPDPLDLTIDEWAVVYDISGVVIEDFAPIFDEAPLETRKFYIDATPEQQEDMREKFGNVQGQLRRLEDDRQKKISHPNVLKGLAVVGYLRANPDTDPREAIDLIGGLNQLKFTESMVPSDDEGVVPDPSLTIEPDEPEALQARNEDGSNGSSSRASLPSSETQVEEPTPTGTGE